MVPDPCLPEAEFYQMGRALMGPGFRFLPAMSGLIACFVFGLTLAGCNTGPEAGPHPLLCGDFLKVGYRHGESIPEVSGTKGQSFGPGRYVITDQLILSSGDVLGGAGSDNTTLYFPD